MARDAVEAVRVAIEGWERGEWRLIQEAFCEDAVWINHTRPDSIYEGHAGLRQAYRSWVGAWTEYASEHGELIDLGDGVVLYEITESGVSKGSGLPVRHSAAVMARVERGKITRLDTYPSIDEARAALGR